MLSHATQGARVSTVNDKGSFSEKAAPEPGWLHLTVDGLQKLAQPGQHVVGGSGHVVPARFPAPSLAG